MGARASDSAGPSPNRTAVAKASPTAKTSAVPSSPTVSSLGMSCGASVFSASTPQRASTMPSPAPVSATTRLSVSSSATSRRRLAPSDARMASSVCRAVPRTRMRLAMLAQAMSSTMPTAPNTAIMAGRTGPTMMSCSSATPAVVSVFSLG